MKKSIVFITILVIGVFLSGCQPKDTTGNATVTGKAYVGGTDGLAVSFVSNAPPDKVFANEDPSTDNTNTFDVNVKVENVGEEDLAKGDLTVKLTGVDPTSFSKTTPDFTGEITSDKLEKTRRSVGEVIPGSYDFVEFNGLAYKYEVAGTYDAVFWAEACYKYKTYTTSKICILEDFFGRGVGEKLCKANEVKPVENSGAPVHVVSIEEQIGGKDSVFIVFKIEHVGDSKDKVFKTLAKSDSKACDDKEINNLNKVGVKVSLGNELFANADCSGVDDAGLARVGSEVRCRKTWTSSDSRIDSEVPLNIELEYDYWQYADKAIKVKQIGT